MSDQEFVFTIGDSTALQLNSEPELDVDVRVNVVPVSTTVVGISDDIKQALLNCFQHVAWKYVDGDVYYDALDAALNAKVLLSITAVYTQSGTVYDTNSLDSLKADLVVTANYDDSTTADVTSACTLSGTLTEGTSTITVAYQGQTATFTVTVAAKPNLVMPTTTYNDTLYYCAVGTDSVPYFGLYLRSASQGRRTVLYDKGTVKLRCRPTPTSSADFLNCAEIDYYPIPIPAGATSVTITSPKMRTILDVVAIQDSNNYYNKVMEGSWDASAASHTYDVSSYNDGTYFALFNLETSVTTIEGFDVTFA